MADGEASAAEIEAFVASFRASFVPGAEEGEKPPEPETIDAEGARLRVLRHGSGDATPVLFLHGFGGDLRSWTLVQPEIARCRPTVAIDLPGHGGSTKEVGGGSIDALMEAIHAATHALGIVRAHLAGHSLGGAVALRYAEAYPNHVASLALVCPAGLGSEIDGAYLDAFLAQTRRRDLQKTLESLFANPALATPDMAEDVIKAKRLTARRRRWRRSRRRRSPADGRRPICARWRGRSRRSWSGGRKTGSSRRRTGTGCLHPSPCIGSPPRATCRRSRRRARWRSGSRRISRRRIDLNARRGLRAVGVRR